MSRWWRDGEQVEAFHWSADADQSEDPAWIAEAARSGALSYLNKATPWVVMIVKTPEGDSVARPGDWVIRQRDGRLRVAPDRVFRREYCDTPGRPRLRLCG
jgi:hypothetical protein